MDHASIINFLSNEEPRSLLLDSSLEDAVHTRELIPGFFVFRMIVLR
jgi:hypothetical protein